MQLSDILLYALIFIVGFPLAIALFGAIINIIIIVPLVRFVYLPLAKRVVGDLKTEIKKGEDK